MESTRSQISSYETGMLIATLSGCAVRGENPGRDCVSGADLKALYAAAKHHRLEAAVGIALQKAGVEDEAFSKAVAKAQYKAALTDTDREALFCCLEERGIWYLPLKGSVLKDYYPVYGMRQMADVDILVDPDRFSEIESVMKELGFQVAEKGGDIHDSYIKPPASHFEIHRALFGKMKGESFDSFYADVKSRLIRDREGGYAFHFSPEDLYCYLTAHEYKHYSYGGTGLRSLLDRYVFLRKSGESLDWDLVKRETEQLGIAEYELKSRTLAMDLFGGKQPDGEERAMLSYLFDSGAYGTQEHSLQNRVRRYGAGSGRLHYLKERIFLPEEIVKTAYPFVYRHRILLPGLALFRLGKSLTTGRKAAFTELKALFGRSRE